ncbi:MAG: DUF1553 domain-containing protein, partial [Bryobacteraceae bacterium]|nr:DUF1553 domain-containing protein [Bryobacteraceae bacterium]
AFVEDGSPDAFAKVVDRLLASPRYGERWARHWLDLVRYAETNGHEYDNDKLEPWRYRDYVIRAFNDDVPYNQFVREHIAGDLLDTKRLRADGATWESPLGTTSLWFNEVLNSATDSVKSRADEVDNQIDVTTKAFLGLTVACARCHDHKFDPIPTADYYSLAGVLHSTELREATLDSPARLQRLQDLSARIRQLNRELESLQSTQPTSPSVFEYRPEDKIFERFDASTFGKWIAQSVAFGNAPLQGAASSLAAGDNAFTGTLTSPKFRTGTELFLHVRIGGTQTDKKLKERGNLRFTSVCDGYKGQHLVPSGSAAPQWQTLRLTFERERTCYFEIVDRSREGHIVVDEIAFSSSEEPPKTTSQSDLTVATDSVSPDPHLTSKLQSLRDEKARLAAQVEEPEFAMIAEDRDPHDVRLHIRGSHQNLGEEIPRQFLQVIAGEQQTPVRSGSGRLQIASALANPANPLTARVMVNRVWKHHFGNGIVRSADNFGRMGELPSHPELLDYLATRFVESGWSVKSLHRLMLLSSTYQMSSKINQAAMQIDPTNKLLHSMPVQRLEAEAIRDSMLAISGTLSPRMYGPGVSPYISSWQEGRGKPVSGPLDGEGRRSVYIQVRRNFLTPMFLAFDYPAPISAIGVRTVSTVPSQALVMMNNAFVAQQASLWAKKVIGEVSEPSQRVRHMYVSAFGRHAEAHEVEQILGFVTTQTERPEAAVWADVGHVLMNSPEYIYVQ